MWAHIAENQEEAAIVAWTVRQVCWKNFARYGILLYRLTWENPHPDKEIATLDLVSEMKNSAVFVIAITVE